MKVRLAVLFAVLCLTLTATAWEQSCIACVFDDGATNGYFNALFIDGPNPGPFGQNISDGFYATQSGSGTGLDFGLWVPAGLVPTTVSWWVGTTPFGSDISSGVENDLQVSFHNYNEEYGYDVYDVHINAFFGNFIASNVYWLTLGNANDSGGTQMDAWDVVPGPATCEFAVGGVNFGNCGTGGEAFTLTSWIPEPGTISLFAFGVLVAAGGGRFNQRRHSRLWAKFT